MGDEMTAKEYCEQLKKIDTIIKNKLIEKKQWLDLALNVTPSMDGERVQSSGNQQKMADAMDNLIDVERQINEYIDELCEKKQDVIKTIEQLPELEYDVLHQIYVQYKSLYEVADDRNITYSWVTSIHGRALKMLDDVLNATESNKKQ